MVRYGKAWDATKTRNTVHSFRKNAYSWSRETATVIELAAHKVPLVRRFVLGNDVVE